MCSRHDSDQVKIVTSLGIEGEDLYEVVGEQLWCNNWPCQQVECWWAYSTCGCSILVAQGT